jgi:molecular chaperone GrpE
MASNDYQNAQDAEAGAAAAAHANSAEGDSAASAEPLDLSAALEQAKSEAASHYEAFLRARADGENAKRRAQEDVAKARKFGTESFAESLLPVMDSLEAALANSSSDAAKLREGVELTLRQLQSAFERNQLSVIDPLGEKFDPHRHQAISTQPVEGVEANHVAAVLQRGWTIADRVLRPALVTVAQ